MKTKEKGPEQADLTRQARRLDRKTLSPLSRLTLAATLGFALMIFVAFLQILLVDGVVALPILVIVVVTGLSAGAVAARWRPAPLLAACVTLFFTAVPLATQQTTYQLTHPAQFLPFIIVVLELAFGLVAIVAGVGATVQNYRGMRR